MPKMQHDKKRRRPVRSCQLTACTKHLSCYRYTAFDGCISTIRYKQLRER